MADPERSDPEHERFLMLARRAYDRLTHDQRMMFLRNVAAELGFTLERLH
jgi:hypothetical protein